MAENIGMTGKTFEKNTVLIKQLNDKTVEGKDGACKSNSVITGIAAKYDLLLDTGVIIQTIANQTNPLEMNDVIESAHAGETEKTFAVFADEIRKLAEESHTQGKQIAAVLKESIEIIQHLITAGSGAAAEGSRASANNPRSRRSKPHTPAE